MFEGLLRPMHLLIILIIVLIIFGPGKLPQIGAGLGRAIREFRKAMTGLSVTESEDETKKIDSNTEKKKPG